MTNNDRVPDPTIEPMDPIEELELADLDVEAARIEENRTHFDPSAPPVPPSKREEPIVDDESLEETDIQDDTPNLDDLTLGALDAGLEPVLPDPFDIE